MAPKETSEFVQMLDDSRQAFHAAVIGVSETQAIIQPAPGRWSVLECVEHVAVVEQRFLSRLESASRQETPRIDKQKEQELAASVVNRASRAPAPEAVQPAARFASLADAMEGFDEVRARTIRFVAERGADLYLLTTEHARFGVLNGAEFLVIISGHVLRHADQIREARAALDRPKS